jgi:hypothetical protein
MSCINYIILCKGLENLWISVCEGVLDTEEQLYWEVYTFMGMFLRCLSVDRQPRFLAE